MRLLLVHLFASLAFFSFPLLTPTRVSRRPLSVSTVVIPSYAVRNRLRGLDPPPFVVFMLLLATYLSKDGTYDQTRFID